ncbi:MAG: tetratricopeptide repeat protein, partial [Rhodobacteraceae bacterium]|nr:tetratricopeptide repeat protein [Paracoccaceae bacterium]
MTETNTLAQARAAHQAGQLRDAEAGYRAVLTAKPDHSEALKLLSGLYRDQGRHEEAAMSLFNLGLAHFGAGHYAEAVTVLAEAVEMKPDWAVAYYNLGVARQKAGDLSGALESFARTVALDPNLSQAYANLAVIEDERGQTEAAVEDYRVAIKINPADAWTAYRFGILLLRQIRRKRLREEVDQADIDEVVQVLTRAAALDDSISGKVYSIGLDLIAKGELAIGWALFEARFFDDTRPGAGGRSGAVRRYPEPPVYWNDQDIRGKTVLVRREGGVGDQVLFGAMLTGLVDRGASVVLDSRPRLERIFKRSFPQINVISRDDRTGKFPIEIETDYQVALGSLGRY